MLFLKLNATNVFLKDHAVTFQGKVLFCSSKLSAMPEQFLFLSSAICFYCAWIVASLLSFFVLRCKRIAWHWNGFFGLADCCRFGRAHTTRESKILLLDQGLVVHGMLFWLLLRCIPLHSQIPWFVRNTAAYTSFLAMASYMFAVNLGVYCLAYPLLWHSQCQKW